MCMRRLETEAATGEGTPCPSRSPISRADQPFPVTGAGRDPVPGGPEVRLQELHAHGQCCSSQQDQARLFRPSGDPGRLLQLTEVKGQSARQGKDVTCPPFICSADQSFCLFPEACREMGTLPLTGSSARHHVARARQWGLGSPQVQVRRGEDSTFCPQELGPG